MNEIMNRDVMKNNEEKIIGWKMVDSKSGYDENGNYVLEETMIPVYKNE